MENFTIDVKIARTGKEPVSYMMGTGDTVGDLIDAAGEEFVDKCVTVDGNNVERNTPLRDGDRVFIGEPVKGNMPGGNFDVELARTGVPEHKQIIVTVLDGWTIQDTIDSLEDEKKALFYNEAGNLFHEFRLPTGGNPVAPTTVIPEDVGKAKTRITCSGRMKGN